MTPISVYVHIPFCTMKCGYCDFNAYAGMDAIKDEYRQALLLEIAAAQPILANRRIYSVAFGGGTPGEVPASHIAEVLAALRASAPFEDGAEISLEANPGSTGAEQLRELAEAGVNRVSFGAQSFDPGELRFLDRIPSPEAIVQSVRNARAAAVASVGLDLIYGLPGQSEAAWRATLSRAIELGVDHVSCYALTVEEGTMLARRVARGQVVPADGDAVADLYETATDVLAAAGYRQYEISNWAKPGHESRHNQVYWTGGEYLGVGAGAHGYVGGERYENVAHPRRYIGRIRRAGHGDTRPATASCYVPDRATAIFDWVTLSLRRMDGFDAACFQRRFGTGLDDELGEPLAEAEAAGIIERDGRVRLTRRGRLLHGELSARILAHLTKTSPLLPQSREKGPGDEGRSAPHPGPHASARTATP